MKNRIIAVLLALFITVMGITAVAGETVSGSMTLNGVKERPPKEAKTEEHIPAQSDVTDETVKEIDIPGAPDGEMGGESEGTTEDADTESERQTEDKELDISIEAETIEGEDMCFGSTIRLKAVINNSTEGTQYSYEWLCAEDEAGEEWHRIGENSDHYDFILDEVNAAYTWKVIVNGQD